MFALRDHADWHHVLAAFRWSPSAREEVLRLTRIGGDTRNEEVLVNDFFDFLLKTLETEKSEVIRISIAVLLEEHCRYLTRSAQKLHALCRVMDRIIGAPVEGNMVTHTLRGQILLCTTSILLELEAYQYSPGIFEAFINTIYGDISLVNNGGDRYFRQMACLCLRELEVALPGLLSGYLGQQLTRQPSIASVGDHTLLYLVQHENTHVCQAYAILFLTVLSHSIIEEAHGENNSDVLNFNVIPYRCRAVGARFQPLDRDREKTVKKAIATVMEVFALFSDWAQLQVTDLIKSFCTIVNIEARVILHHFWPLLQTDSIVLVHSVIHILEAYAHELDKKAWHGLVRRLFMVIQDASYVSQLRQIAIRWLLALPTFGQSSTVTPSLLYDHYQQLYPAVDEPTDLKDAKLQSLLECFDTERFKPPVDIMRCLDCMFYFRYLSSTGRPTLIVFRFLDRLMQRFPTFAKEFEVQDFLHSLLREKPRFIPNSIQLVDRMIYRDKLIGFHFLRSFGKLLTTIEPPSRLKKYFLLMRRVAREVEISPELTIAALNRLVQSPPLCEDGTWAIGHSILSVCKLLMIVHPTSTLFKPMVELLHFIMLHFNDINIRDDATLYWQIFTHTTHDKLVCLLEGQDAQNGWISKRRAEVFMTPVVADRIKLNHEEMSNLVLIRSTKERLDLGIDDKGTAIFSPQDHRLLLIPSLFDITAGYSRMSQFDMTRLLIWYREQLKSTSHSILLPLRLRYSYKKKRQSAHSDFRVVTGQYSLVHSPSKPGSVSTNGSVSPLTLGQSNSSIVHSQPHPHVTIESVYNNVPMPTKIVAVVLSFSCSASYIPLESIHLPVLSKHPSRNPPADALERFPFVYKIKLRVQPLSPEPTSFDVSVVFNDIHGQTYTGMLEPFSVKFQDLFLPVSLTHTALQSHEPLPPLFLQDFFCTLWNSLAPPLSAASEVRSVEKLEMSDSTTVYSAVESVKLLQLSREKVNDLIETKLKPFLVHYCSTNADGSVISSSRLNEDSEPREDEYDFELEKYLEDDYFGDPSERERVMRELHDPVHVEQARALIFIPPQYHILMRWSICERTTLVRMRTDRWQLLKYLDNYFDD
eukprot:GILK01013542.1.p1 GENE.GILK01013542.1~~GILK01013542.1.p1  ORF type:complete len:1095 (-),score=184.93 GILK01013542.1:17-3301(-)